MKLGTPTTWLRLAAVSGALAVAIGAFGAHGLKTLLAENGTTATFQTAAAYHLTHTLAMLVPQARRHHGLAACHFFALGIFFFSGSLYTLAVFNLRWMGAVAPIGGTAFILGWLWLAKTAGEPSQENT
ncbi:DUF423 domain-containing protein [Acanthopleuribacter pedis]|uniref:DUF423 domain-containing protein n=1 Tax=Acanthopleuribacter pedis TaxID=442870 RepID=A0A8J7QH88_9BACT|nr:DUF423 domain-containing protein [Acanthopleuribacter pedis]MBO1322365.1 DUF423 domain-containing protein [Acanthopleuribacter pedis]